MRLLIHIIILSILSIGVSFAQSGSIAGVVENESGPIEGAIVTLDTNGVNAVTNANGEFLIDGLQPRTYQMLISCLGCKDEKKSINVVAGKTTLIKVKLSKTEIVLKMIDVIAENINPFGIGHLRNVEDFAIYAGKKSELVNMDKIIANVATNNGRQIFSGISGLNIHENDNAGIQMGIGGRGMDPNRISNFNTRQNGYDMSADALGYPDSYYVPPAEAVQKIQLVRGASSLQYGPQFGGFLNFKLRGENPTKKLEVRSRNTVGSYNLFNSFNSINGSILDKRLDYYCFYQKKMGEGWRPNSKFNVNTAHLSTKYYFTDKLNAQLEYTFMDYLAQQPGGLTDDMFADDPAQSIRARNWFKVNWNLASLKANYKYSDDLKFNTMFFSLVAKRAALGVLSNINRPDFESERDLWIDDYKNWGNETRMIYNYTLKDLASVLLVGTRYYSGLTIRQQGLANNLSTGTKDDFKFLNNVENEFSSYSFPGHNISFFTENLFQVTKKISVTPGLRFEYISTKAEGYYRNIEKDLAGNVIFNSTEDEMLLNNRSFIIGGVGLSYQPKRNHELYANISQNYRAIGFSDMRVTNPNLIVDTNLIDETGFSADIGARGNWKDFLSYDVTLFILKYNDRIGTVLTSDPNTFNLYRYRTNISDSRNMGIELLCEFDIWKLFFENTKTKVLLLNNFSWINAQYINSSNAAIEGNNVELVPEIIYRSGITIKREKLGVSIQYSYTAEQFTDATNAIKTSNAVNGLIPAYYVLDLSASYKWKYLTFSGGLNNLTNNTYFTRRADGYPGPGIIPATPLNYYASLEIKF